MSLLRMIPFIAAMTTASLVAQTFPEPSALPGRAELPDALVLSSGVRVESKEQWVAARAPELRALFQHYEYGVLPAKPERFEAKVLRTDAEALGGKATLKEIEIRCGKPDATVHLLLVVPNGRARAAGCFLTMNFNGNHALLADPQILLPEGWVRGPGERATDADRGKEIATWNIAQTIERGYAFASFFSGDVVPDKMDLAVERLKQFLPAGKSAEDADAPGTIVAWAWGFSRMVDYLVTDPDIDAKRIAVVGHSRNGKTALLAGVMDERIALIIPSQAGCGGSAPCRMSAEMAALQPNGRPVAETVAVINGNFPHWFCGNFKAFNQAVVKLPFDQHELIALCAPRPVLLSCATGDRWANPGGQFEMLRAADPVYRLVAGEGCDATAMPETGKLLASRLGYFIRPGAHSMTAVDWSAWLEFADKWLR